MLIMVVGEATYSLMCHLCSPSFPEDKTYAQLVKLVTDHFQPQRSEIAERHVFRQRRQRVSESFTEYLQALKHMAATCNFSSATLEDNLEDQFVSGLANDAMQSKIFTERETTGVSPAVAQRRRLRTRLNALRPDTAAVVRAAQERKVELSGDNLPPVPNRGRSTDYTVRGDKRVEGKVVKETGPLSYKVDVGNGVEMRQHADQLLPANSMNKSRFSLSRTSMSTGPEEPGVSKDAEGDMLEDAFDDAACDEAPRTEAASSPASSASARALRAYNRAKRTLIN